MSRINVTDRHRRARHLPVILVLVLLLAAAQPWVWGLTRRAALAVRANQVRPSQVEDVHGFIDSLRSEQARRQASRPTLRSVTPLPEDTLYLLETLESVARQSGIDIEVTSIGEAVADPAGDPRLLQLPVFLSAAGPPVALLNYAERLENLQELTSIQRLVFAPNLDRADAIAFGTHAANIELIFYLQDSSHELSE